MATFKCEVVELEIHEHPNADAIEIAQVRGYQSIVKKGQFKTGDLAVYIPEQSVVPVWVLRELGMWDETRGKGGLAGSKGNRVKAVKLRGVLSQGLLFPLTLRYSHEEIHFKTRKCFNCLHERDFKLPSNLSYKALFNRCTK